MNLAALNLLNMWWEKADGSRLAVNIEDVRDCPPVEEYPFAHVRFPLQVKTEIYRRRADGLYGGTDRIAVGESGASATLVLALATGGRRTWRRLWRRHQSFPLGDAMIIASEACERCLNALAYEYGLDWGYPEYSSQWRRANTVCEMCATYVLLPEMSPTRAVHILAEDEEDVEGGC